MILYESLNLKAIYKDLNTSTLVITFNGRNKKQNKDIFFGNDFLSKNDISHLLISCNDNTWYQYSDMDCLISKINDLVIKNHSRVLLYGSSMGGYASLLTSQYLIKCDVCIAISPQYKISSKFNAYDNRWFDDLKKTSIIHQIRKVNLKTKYYIIYDQFHDKDSYHINKFINDNKPFDYKCIMLPFSGHVPFDVGKKTLSALILKIIKKPSLNLQDYIEFKRSYNSLKVNSPTYKINMVKFLFSKKKKQTLPKFN